MKLRLEDLGCRTLELSSQGDTDMDLLFQDIESGSGRMEFGDGLTVMENLAIRQVLALFKVRMASGLISMSEPGMISHLCFDGRIRNGFVGDFKASHFDCKGFCAELTALDLKANLVAEGISLKVDSRGGIVELGTLTCEGITVERDDLRASAAIVTISGVKVEWGHGDLKLAARRVQARELHVRQGDLAIELGAIEVEEFFMDEGIKVGSLKAGPLSLTTEFPKPDIDTSTTPEGVSEDSVDGGVPIENVHQMDIVPNPTVSALPEAMRLKNNAFDTINGQLNADVRVNISLPVVGKRKATHRFRLTIDGGIFNYRELESGLSALEDAFVDIRLRKDRLQIERDIPLIPGFRKAIAYLKLEPGEVELAEKHLVRLRTLRNFEMAEADSDNSDKKKSVRLHALEVDNIDIHMSLDETEVLRRGEGWLRAHIDELDVGGRLAFRSDKTRAEALGAIECRGRGLGVVMDKLLFGERELSAALTVGSIEHARTEFLGFVPTALDLKVKSIDLGHFEMRPAPSAD